MRERRGRGLSNWRGPTWLPAIDHLITNNRTPATAWVALAHASFTHHCLFPSRYSAAKLHHITTPRTHTKATKPRKILNPESRPDHQFSDIQRSDRDRTAGPDSESFPLFLWLIPKRH